MTAATGKSLQLHCDGIDRTFELGQAVGRALVGGEVFALNGPLGAGKTQFVKAVASGLGYPPRLVCSPSFVLVREYPARLRIYHIDAYRLQSEAELLALGVEEMVEPSAVVLLEWAEKVESVLPQNTVTVKMEITGPTSRRVLFSNLPEYLFGPLRSLANRFV